MSRVSNATCASQTIHGCERSGLDGSLRMESVGCTIALAEIYDKVEFATGTG